MAPGGANGVLLLILGFFEKNSLFFLLETKLSVIL